MEPDILESILDGREKPTNLPFALLKNITENFSEDRVIGQGGFATVYKGILPKGCVAVKRIRNNHSIDERLFHRELDSLLTVNHQNVVRFLGFCASTEQAAIKIEGSSQHIYAEIRERLLCFEYISNGSLQEYLTDELRGLDWNIRYQIIKGICEGLHHLHKEKHIYHMDLKPANILLDNHMVPKITDFGLSRLDEKSQTMSEGRCGTLGYCSPEYLLSGKMSFKSDMFSLGIIMAELVTGNKGIPDNNKNNVLRRWRHRLKKSGKGTPLVYQQVAKCIEFGSLWQDIDLSKRPFIWDIIHDIREIEGVDGKINNAYEYTFGQITSEDEMLGIEPLELHFPFELNKQLSCSLKLTNETDSHTAFYIQNMSPLPYCIQPQKGIVPPRSECRIDITLEPQDKAPKDMLRADEFLVSSTKVNGYLAAEDITTSMFNKEKGVIDEVSLDVLFDAHKKIEVLDGSHCLPLELYVSLDTNKLDKIQVVKSLHQEVPLPTSSSKNRKRIFKVEAFRPMDTDCVASTLKVLTDGIRECYAGRMSNLPVEELYRCSYNLVLHKHGEELYSAVEAAMASEVKDLGRALDGVPDGMQFLQELLAKWDHHRKVVSFNKDVMYMDRTFVIRERKTRVYELGLHLWRDCVIRSNKVRPRLINVVRRERGSEYATSSSTSVIGSLIAGVSKMLKELGDDVYLEVMEAGVEALHHKAMDVVDQLDKKAMDAPPL